MTVATRFEGEPAANLRGADSTSVHDERREEVWEGEVVVSPLADMEHQDLVAELITILGQLILWPGRGRVYAGCNVSDRDKGWEQNFRIPDIAVVLKGNPALIRATHLVGGPDFVVEILSEDDRAVEKLPFYAQIGVREALFIRRSPWSLEFYRHGGANLKLLQTSTTECSETLHCQTLPLSLSLLAEASETGGRPILEVVEIGGGLRRRI